VNFTILMINITVTAQRNIFQCHGGGANGHGYGNRG
jgi:hypothetical protein